MKVVILAGGLGSRLAEETAIVPKPLVMVEMTAHVVDDGHNMEIGMGVDTSEVFTHDGTRSFPVGTGRSLPLRDGGDKTVTRPPRACLAREFVSLL